MDNASITLYLLLRQTQFANPQWFNLLFYTIRSPKTGLYNILKNNNLSSPTDAFDIDYFRDNPAVFYELAKDLYPGQYQPNYSHYFVKLLCDKGLLGRMYTQNIDGLERCNDMAK